MLQSFKAGFNESLYRTNPNEFYYIATTQSLLSVASIATITALILAISLPGNMASSALLSAKITGCIGLSALVASWLGNLYSSLRQDEGVRLEFFITEGFKTVSWATAGPLVFSYNVFHGNAQEDYYDEPINFKALLKLCAT